MSATGVEEVVVRRAGDLGVSPDSEPPLIRDVGDYGWGTDLKTPAWEQVREQIDPADHPAKTHVATIHYDLDAWEFVVEFLVEVERQEQSG